MRCLSRRDCLVLLAGAPQLAWSQPAVPPEVSAELPGARLRGSGRATVLGLHIYDIRLWVDEAFTDYPKNPLALEIEYGRSLSGKLIADRSLKEMKRGGEIDDEKAERWLAFMRSAFPDVAKGDRITGVFQPGEAARFFVNGKFKAQLRDAGFAQRFFGIWLAAHTSEPKLREALLGQGKV
jgi:hypothetical protein